MELEVLSCELVESLELVKQSLVVAVLLLWSLFLSDAVFGERGGAVLFGADRLRRNGRGKRRQGADDGQASDAYL